MVPEIRIQSCNTAKVHTEAEFVLYWMTSFRRTNWNFSLDRAVYWALELSKPLVILEALRCDYPWASKRFHKFIIEGMNDNASRLSHKNVTYYPFIEQKPKQSRGLLKALSKHAAVIVTDYFPAFFIPHMIESAAKKVKVKLEKVDSNGLLPMRATDKIYSRAFDFRRFLQHNLPFYFGEILNPEPLEGAVLPRLASLPDEILERWPAADLTVLKFGRNELIKNLSINQKINSISRIGGMQAALDRLALFMRKGLKNYPDLRNEPDREITSALSPYLHFGHISAHQVFQEITKAENWKPNKISDHKDGSRNGWWGMSRAAEMYLDQLITWRELGFNMCWQKPDYDKYESLPPWALKTLEIHAGDPRAYIYSFEEFEQAKTHDPIWNSAQKQLLIEGRIHNYLRMLWGKKILEWTPHPKIALEVMIELNNKYALDGRDPNSYSGIFWILGRYDRAWGPERPIFGKVRYMSSENTARKVKIDNYIRKYEQQLSLLD